LISDGLFLLVKFYTSCRSYKIICSQSNSGNHAEVSAILLVQTNHSFVRNVFGKNKEDIY